MNFSLLLPELTIVGVVSILAFLEIYLPHWSRRLGLSLNLGGLVLVGGSLATIIGRQGTTFQGAFGSDPFAVFFKYLFLVSAAWVFWVKKEDVSRNSRAEFYLIFWSMLLGMFFLVSSKDFLLFFISLELLTLSLYILTAYHHCEARLPIEAGLKYLILGSLASAFYLYGTSLVYAASGTFSFESLRVFSSAQSSNLLMVGLLFILSALCFKIAAVPFHIWVPDVYQGASSSLVGFLSVASKAAGFAGILRILFEALGGWDPKRQVLFSFLAVLTLLYGNLGALVQKDIKRLLGFSSIGHVGFLLIALALNREYVGKSLFYYLIAYGLTNLTAFYVISLMENRGSGASIEAYHGLARRAPVLAAGLFLALLSLAGIPPLAGFFAKFLVLWSAAKSGIFWIVLVGVINVAISLYYYLNVVRALYFEKAKDESPVLLSLPSQVFLWGLMGGIVLVGVWQSPFFRLVSFACEGMF